MNYKYMRAVLFFDLPVVSPKQRKDAQKFARNLKKLGFFMLQESVYVKMNLDDYYTEQTVKAVDAIKPSEGSIMILNVTEKQFQQMRILLGEFESDVISTDERLIEL